MAPAVVRLPMLLALSFASASVIELSPADDWCAAVAAAAPGDELRLSAGDYAGPCWVRQSVHIVGTDARIVYDGASSNVIDVEADNVTIEGLSFGPTQADIDAIKIRSGSAITVVRCTFTGVGGISVSANSADTDDVALLENTFTDLAATGVYLGCHDGGCVSSDFRIVDNHFDGVTSSGVGYAIETKLNSWGAISDNDIRDAQGPGITVYGSAAGDPTLVERNVVVGSRNAATLEIGGGPVVVRNNVVIGGPVGGLYVYDYGDRGVLSDVIVASNTLWGVGGPAVELSDWDASTMSFLDNAAGRDDGAAALPTVASEGNVECASGCWNDPSALDLWPVVDGPLVGVAITKQETDLCGVSRPDPATVGALEPGGTGNFSSPDAYSCPTAAEDDTGADTGDDTKDGCGCSSGPSSVVVILPFVALVARRRQFVQ